MLVEITTTQLREVQLPHYSQDAAGTYALLNGGALLRLTNEKNHTALGIMLPGHPYYKSHVQCATLAKPISEKDLAVEIKQVLHLIGIDSLLK